MAHPDEIRAIAERIAALSASQIRTSEIITNVMKDNHSGVNKPDANKKVKSKASKRPTPTGL